MEPVIERLTSTLTRHFPGAKLELTGFADSKESVMGYMEWDGFEMKTQSQRQRSLWEVIRGLDVQDQLQIASILTLTPAERDFFTQDATEDDF